MNRLVAVRADPNISAMTELTMPIIRHFCSRWRAGLYVLDHSPEVNCDDGAPHYRILKLRELFRNCPRILSLDADVLLMPRCPDPFDEVPAEKLGTVWEDVGNREANRRHRMYDCQLLYPDAGWKAGYPNTGFMMLSRHHAAVLEPADGRYYSSHGSDDVHIGYQIHKLGIPVHELSWKWNHMTLFSDHPLGHDRFQSYVIHYAGAGIFDEGVVKTKLEQIKMDIRRVYG